MVSLCRSASKKYVIRFTNVRCRCDCFHVTSQRGLSFGKAPYLIAFIFKTSVSVYFWFLLTLYSAEAIIVPHRMVWSWYTGCWWVSCYIWYNDEGIGRDHSPQAPPRCTHSSTVSVQTTVFLYNGPLLCGFKVLIKIAISRIPDTLNELVEFVRIPGSSPRQVENFPKKTFVSRKFREGRKGSKR